VTRRWQRTGQPPHQGGEDRSIRPVHAWTGVGAAQDGDFVPQHEELDVFSGGLAAYQQDQSEHLPEDQVQQPQRHAGIMSDRQSPLVATQARLVAPHSPVTQFSALPPGEPAAACCSPLSFWWSSPRPGRCSCRAGLGQASPLADRPIHCMPERDDHPAHAEIGLSWGLLPQRREQARPTPPQAVQPGAVAVERASPHSM
jgi:hypothetical protein